MATPAEKTKKNKKVSNNRFSELQENDNAEDGSNSSEGGGAGEDNPASTSTEHVKKNDTSKGKNKGDGTDDHDIVAALKNLASTISRMDNRLKALEASAQENEGADDPQAQEDVSKDENEEEEEVRRKEEAQKRKDEKGEERLCIEIIGKAGLAEKMAKHELHQPERAWKHHIANLDEVFRKTPRRHMAYINSYFMKQTLTELKEWWQSEDWTTTKEAAFRRMSVDEQWAEIERIRLSFIKALAPAEKFIGELLQELQDAIKWNPEESTLNLNTTMTKWRDAYSHYVERIGLTASHEMSITQRDLWFYLALTKNKELWRIIAPLFTADSKKGAIKTVPCTPEAFASITNAVAAEKSTSSKAPRSSFESAKVGNNMSNGKKEKNSPSGNGKNQKATNSGGPPIGTYPGERDASTARPLGIGTPCHGCKQPWSPEHYRVCPKKMKRIETSSPGATPVAPTGPASAGSSSAQSKK